MSSVVLYLAIVVMWLCVLVPMWLRRDRTTFVDAHDSAEPYDRPMEGYDPLAGPETGPMPTAAEAALQEGARPEGAPEDEPLPETGPMPTAASLRMERRRAAQRRRARQVAKRRRLTFWCTLLVLASTVTAAVRVIPWWGVAPSAVLLVGYLSILRVSVRMDAERRRAAQARAERARRARRLAAEREARRPVAEIIDLTTVRDEIFDQYAENPARAVGD
ncbi:hypothetical protein ACFFMN_29625 [Planobispora siamensis]|uniref:Uncharacterized protein n=1 Tax=Planobispora siamensis TaxID=936338 RepID=A0A8J3WJH2_9ACTN|nr:hypothetical protein [Planobispora siamensis]GIH91653.1 hypothetical protein Psi01_22830 [Planobispora siamensis]